MTRQAAGISLTARCQRHVKSLGVGMVRGSRTLVAAAEATRFDSADLSWICGVAR